MMCSYMDIIIKKVNFEVYIGCKDTLPIHPHILKWYTGEYFVSYMYAIGSPPPPPKSLFVNWHNMLAPQLKSKWSNVWDKMAYNKNGVSFLVNLRQSD